MIQVLNGLLRNRHIYLLSKNNKRFAGHSKWQNIKHIKEENDNKRMVLFNHLKIQMTIAIQGNVVFIMSYIIYLYKIPCMCTKHIKQILFA